MRNVRKPSVEDLASMYGVGMEPIPPPHDGIQETWSPSLGPAQQVIFDSKARYILAYGERFSGKSVGALQKLVRHVYEHENAHVLMVVGVRRQATAGGAWYKLLNEVLPQWKDNLEGFDFSGEKMTVDKDIVTWVTNKHGGWGLIHLVSIPYGQNLAARIRGIEASAIFVDELVGIGGPEYFDALVQQIGRRSGIPPEDQFFIAATNPGGPSDWQYTRFFETPVKSDGTWDERYLTVHVPIAENPSPNAVAYYQNVLEAVRNDPVEHERMILGKWVDRPSGEAIFAKNFVPAIHVRGSVKDNLVLHPKPGMPITIGYDLGDRNHSITFMQERLTREKTLWVAFDEIVYTDSNVSYDVLVPELMQKMQEWCDAAEHDFSFTHISDKSAFDRFRAATGSYDHRQIEKLSREQLAKYPNRYPKLKKPIRLLECPKPSGSVAGRVKLLINLLQREEIFISDSCERIKTMLNRLESEKNEPYSPKRSAHLHVFDSLTYPLYYSAMGGSVPTTSPNVPQVLQVGS